jgi:demethylspheroidene O-methyltransferase
MGWREWWLGRRDRILMDAGFQRWATSFPLTRPLARRRARAVFDLCAGFVYSQVLLACVRLGVFERLRAGPLPAAELGATLGLPAAAAGRLLDAAVSLRLLSRRPGARLGLGDLGLVVAANPGLAALVEHHALLYPDLADPVALLAGGTSATRMAGFWPYASAERPAGLAPAAVRGYTEVMSASQPLVAAEVLAAYPMDRHHRLLDVGGGDGRFLCAVARHHPRLALGLFDLPAVVELARRRLEEAGLAARVAVRAGDFRVDPLPEGADLVTLVRILHDHPDEVALSILGAVRQALPPGGTLLVAEPMAATAGAEPVAAAYFGLYLLAMAPGGSAGRLRTPEELAGLGRRAGFGRFREVATRTPLIVRLVVMQP